MIKRTVTMTWGGLAGLDEEDDDRFFDSTNRISTIVPVDLLAPHSSPSSSDDDDDDDETFDDPRISFASAASRLSFRHPTTTTATPDDYNIWMAAPGSIKERRRRLLQGMGLNSNRDLLRLTTFTRNNGKPPPPQPPTMITTTMDEERGSETQTSTSSPSPSPSPCNVGMVLFRSRSDGDMEYYSADTKKRKEAMIGTNVSKQRLTRTSSNLAPCARICKVNANAITIVKNDVCSGRGGSEKGSTAGALTSTTSNRQFGAFFLIKNLDTGKEFVVKEFDEDGMWNRLSDLQTGKQLTMEEFEKSVGTSPMVKELMRRQNVGRSCKNGGVDHKMSAFARSFRYSKRRGVSLLKNIKSAANTMTGFKAEKEKEHNSPPAPEAKQGKNSGNSNTSEWVRVRQQGKSYKELTAVRLCQEIQAHEGSIWTIKFNSDGRYLASAGEDKIIHIWEVQECEVASLMPPDLSSANATPLHPMACPSPDRPSLHEVSSLDKRKKGKSASKKGNIMPDYVQLPETVFALSEEPVCSFEGHLDDVLDLSWSKTQVRYDRQCELVLAAPVVIFLNGQDVTCIQFNPMDDEYFISGSLDAKVRIWNIPGRRVVDWTDLHEMVTAACYTPDGQGAVVGSHKGSCRMYSTTDGKLNQTSQFEIENMKKSHPKKITGFEFVPDSPADVLVTSADSRIRIYEGSELMQKFRGFRNTSSQIAASFSPDWKYIICASEDSHVFIWKREEHRGKGKGLINTKSFESFQCKDVSVAVPWPGSTKFEPPTILHSKRHSKRTTPALSQPQPPTDSPTKDDAIASTISKRHLPPLPKKNKASDKSQNNNSNNNAEKAPNSPEADPSSISRTESGIDDSFSSVTGPSLRYGDSPSISSYSHTASPSWSPGWSWFEAGGHGNDTMQATAWGLVIVTAGLGGQIRAYQNFGLPLRVGRQTNLFRDHS
ncbi:WD repeat-containing protein [Drosera capensis]